MNMLKLFKLNVMSCLKYWNKFENSDNYIRGVERGVTFADEYVYKKESTFGIISQAWFKSSKRLPSELAAEYVYKKESTIGIIGQARFEFSTKSTISVGG